MNLVAQRSFLLLISVLAAVGFGWPLVFPTVGISQSQGAGWLTLALLPILAVLALALFQGQTIGPRQIALLGILASTAAATRIALSGVGGFELIFVIIILGAAAIGPRFGFLLGATSVLISSLFFGGIGPWTAFQVFAIGWVGLGAGLLKKHVNPRRIWPLAAYAFASSYVFGLIMNLWFWPFAIGPQTSLSYQPEASLSQNLVSFLSYSLVSSTLSWDSVRAISSAVGILLIGKPVLATLSRYRF